jgi:hypothetical protein
MGAVTGNCKNACFLCSMVVTLGAVIKGRPYSNKIYNCFVKFLTLKEEHKFK